MNDNCEFCKQSPSGECMICQLRRTAKQAYQKMEEATKQILSGYQNIRDRFSGYEPQLARVGNTNYSALGSYKRAGKYQGASSYGSSPRYGASASYGAGKAKYSGSGGCKK